MRYELASFTAGVASSGVGVAIMLAGLGRLALRRTRSQ